MNTKTFFPCGGGPNLISGRGMENLIFLVMSWLTISITSLMKFTFNVQIHF